jgi:hypothetical protein
MKKCLHCGNDFEPTKPKSVYCSGKCRTYAFRDKKKTEKLSQKINYIKPAAEVFDGAKLNSMIIDEVGMWQEEPKELNIKEMVRLAEEKRKNKLK